MINSSDPVLLKLRDIHLPPEISWWPLAPGWYFLILCSLILTGLGGYYLYRWWQHYQIKRSMLNALANLQETAITQPPHQIAMQLTQLIRRVILLYYPEVAPGKLIGDTWQTFLIEQAKFPPEYAQQLTLLTYQPHAHLTDIHHLLASTQEWFKKLGRKTRSAMPSKFLDSSKKSV